MDKKERERKELAKLLGDTLYVNPMVSELKFESFQKEMALRRESLAFRMKKIYCIKDRKRLKKH